MTKKILFPLIAGIAFIFTGCGGGGGTPTTPTPKVTISGKITYNRVPVQNNGSGLDYGNTYAATAKLITIQAIDGSHNLVESTTTDASGNYTFSQIPESTDIQIYILAEMKKNGASSWNVDVVDNTNSNALYVVAGSLLPSGTTNSTRDYHLPSGWTGNSYGNSRLAAPFAILDDIYAAMQTLLAVDSNTIFENLVVNWSTENTTSSGDKTQGQIGTSHYTDGNLFILGDMDNDTDEYDDHVITHEWGHYYEDKFSRSDSIGGNHGGGDKLDIRVAFGEGWGNAFSAISLNDPLYFDSFDNKQNDGWSMDLESDTETSQGWYSESSIQNIIYDLWDANDDVNDNLTLGFAPIHHVFTGAQKTTPAFTSIFSFIKILKDENSASSDAIDDIVLDEAIDSITDIYGSENSALSEYPYHDLTVGNTIQVKTSNTDGAYNKLSNRQYVKFHISTAGSYTITIEKNTSPSDTDPDFLLYQASPFSYIGKGESTVVNKEEQTISLAVGDYLLDVSEYNNINNVTLDVTVQ